MIMVEYFQTYVSETNGLNCKNVDYRIFVQEKWESYSNGWAQLVAQMVKNPLAMWEIWVQSLYLEDPLEKEMATHSSILAWRIPMNREARWATIHGVTKSRM